MIDISVVIPMYNAEETIIRCLDSVFDQTYKANYQIIIVNDGSTDNSLSIVQKYIYENDKKNITLINKINGGVSSARNVGLKESKGKWIALLDSDDEWLPQKLEIQMPFLCDMNNDFVACNRNSDKVAFPYVLINDRYAIITLRKLLLRVVGQTSTAVFERKIINNTGYFDENQKYSEDANYWMRISLNNNMIILNDSLVVTGNWKPTFGHSGLSANIYEMEKGVRKNIKEMFLLDAITGIEYCFFSLIARLKYWIRMIKIKTTHE